MYGAEDTGRWWRDRHVRYRLAGHVQRGRSRFDGLLFAQALQRGVGFDEGRVHGLDVARDQPGRHALRENVVKQALEDSSRQELAGAADGRVPGQVLVHLVAQKLEDIQAQGAVLH